MKYGIICAMESEINLLLQDILASDKKAIAHREFIEGNLYGKDVVLVKSGIGKVAASLTTTILIDRFNVDEIIFCGTAGGIDKALNVGDVVIGDYTVQHDVVVMGELFTIPRVDVDYFPSNKNLTSALYNAVTSFIENDLKKDIPQSHLDEFHIRSPKAVIGTVASGDQFICDGSKNAWLEENVRNIQCVEMEGAAVAQVCYEFDIPFGIIRVISDSANDGSAVDFDAFVVEAASHFTRGTMKAFLSK
ncbi:5'-methylthioadenosine/adenosylhomocysteine nucleosidase [Paludicola sp. MB14-C6]|uniref:5'-methylthioadenosine/adenosylhomocysteine nucleosidase n=1 Tax=Paludihabitans sp. MB14-C6 TaxID=3070656 RepID=UPI0027DDBA21|nr:5'-methylthioadenosine/adenosylhomocysteine nucleosidase [Paludicola sp. MB14-C6]WMJ22556.1 5'-methylthioadenosine/adenosylhomocysteine nucleosidase [Paludicola sp. MB14-C6]